MGLLAVSRRRYISRNFRSALHHADAARAEGIAVTLHIKMYAGLGVHKIANYYRALRHCVFERAKRGVSECLVGDHDVL